MTGRTGARLALALGLLASLAGNALAAQPTVLGRVVAAWAPMALAVVVWLVEHYRPAPGPWRVATWAGTAVVATVAAWVSYWHLVDLALSAGETGAAAYLLPLSVDGLILVATAYLREATPTPAVALVPSPRVRKVAVAPTPPRAATPSSPQSTGIGPVTARPTAGPERGDGVPPLKRTGKTSPVDRELVRRIASEHPDWTQQQVAESIGCGVRTVRRHLTDPAPAEDDVPAVPAVDEIDQLLHELTPAALNGAHA